jgi:hypothetical protein
MKTYTVSGRKQEFKRKHVVIAKLLYVLGEKQRRGLLPGDPTSDYQQDSGSHLDATSH